MLPILRENLGENVEAAWKRLLEISTANDAMKLPEYYKCFRFADVQETQAKKAVKIVVGKLLSNSSMLMIVTKYQNICQLPS